MTFSVFTTTKYIKENTAILAYVNDDELRTLILPAQDIHIERALGTRLYNLLGSRIQAGTLTVNDKLLLDKYVQPALMYWVVYEYLLISNYKLTNKSLSKQDSDNSQPSSLQEVNYFKSSIRDWAEYYTQRITDYLWENLSIFPEYMQATGYVEKVGKANNYLFGGMYIPKSLNCPAYRAWDYIDIIP